MAKNNKDDDKTLEAIKRSVSRVPGMRLATEEETAALVDQVTNNPHLKAMCEDMDKPDYPDRLHALVESWYAESASRDITLATLPAFLAKLAAHPHDYNTIAHAVAAAALAAARAMDRSEHGGITGFQAGAVFWQFYGRWLHEEGPARILKYRDMLYPQHEEDYTSISKDTMRYLQDEARKSLRESPDAHADVRAHWRKIADGVPPFGLTVRD